MSDPVDITFLRAGGTRLLVPDIDLSNPETEKAATKIQALFRGHTTRQNMKSGDTKEAVQDLEAEFNPNDQGRPRQLELKPNDTLNHNDMVIHAQESPRLKCDSFSW